MTIHIGLIGGGNITETHARAARAIPGVEISAIHGTNNEKIARLCHEHGGTPYQDFDPFLRHRPMDLVIIGSPSGLHATQGIAATRQGLHVLSEKPIEISTARTDSLIEAAKKSNVQLGVIFQDRMKPHIRQLKSWLDQGLLGRPIIVDARVKWYRPPEYYSNSRWRGTFALDGGAALINQGIHTVDLLLWLFGEVTRVQARIGTLLHKIEAEDTAAAILRTRAAAEPAALDENQSASSAAVTDFRGHQAVLEDFLQAIQQNRVPACDGLEGRRSIALVEAIYRAAKTPDRVATV